MQRYFPGITMIPSRDAPPAAVRAPAELESPARSVQKPLLDTNGRLKAGRAFPNRSDEQGRADRDQKDTEKTQREKKWYDLHLVRLSSRVIPTEIQQPRTRVDAPPMPHHTQGADASN